MEKLLAAMREVVGERYVLTGEAAAEKTFSRWTRLGNPLAVVLPGSTGEVAALLRLANAAGTPVTPWGGKTGLVDGAYADNAIALSLERMSAIEEIDTASATMTVQAGCVLQAACEAAEDKGLFLPIDLGSRGSATVGGLVSTNAGGNRVLRYGMTRASLLGLEAVLADGTVISSMRGLMKDNAGYDLKQMFVGTEGTLGVVTRAVLRLRPAPVSQQTAFAGVGGFEALPALLHRLDGELGGSLSAFEVMWPSFYELVTNPPAQGRPVLAGRHAYYVLVEALAGGAPEDEARFERVLMDALGDGIIEDAAVAKSQQERDRMWALRDDTAQTVRNPPIFAFDVSLRISGMEAYVGEVGAGIAERWPEATLTVFGHLGDGNLHLIVGGAPREDRAAVEEVIYRGVRERGGSVSAEHGIGLQKRAHLADTRSAAEIALMRRLKAALDPNGVLNPGKVFEARG